MSSAGRVRVFILWVLSVFFVSASFAQEGYTINLALKPYKNQYVYLGYHYGKVKALADSVKLDAGSKGVFKGTKPLPGGIYFIVSPSKQILFEVLVGDDQHFSISADTSLLPAGVKYEGSLDNSAFQNYSIMAGKNGKAMTDLRQKLGSGMNAKDSSALIHEIRELNMEMQKFRDSIIKKSPNSLLSMLFNAMKEPVIPPAPKTADGKTDSSFAYRYFKTHYWDEVSFADDRLVRTPFFELKLDKYFRDLVVPHPDSLAREIDRMLLESRTAPEMFRYLLVRFVQEYVNPKYMGQDAVFVHLFEKYINTGKAAFFTPQYREFLNKRAYSLMANLIGKSAANLDMVDLAGKPAALYDADAEYTVLLFWDPTCGHCKELVPKLDSIYEAKWKEQGVMIYAVKVDGPDDEWRKLIKEYHLDDWKHVYQLPSVEQAITREGLPGLRQLYDVYQTPVLYLLDREKRIIAKRLDYLQLDDILQMKIRNKS